MSPLGESPTAPREAPPPPQSGLSLGEVLRIDPPRVPHRGPPGPHRSPQILPPPPARRRPRPPESPPAGAPLLLGAAALRCSKLPYLLPPAAAGEGHLVSSPAAS